MDDDSFEELSLEELSFDEPSFDEPSFEPPSDFALSSFFSFEESQSQILRNMKTIGIDLEPYVRRKLLTFHTSRPSTLRAFP